MSVKISARYVRGGYNPQTGTTSYFHVGPDAGFVILPDGEQSYVGIVEPNMIEPLPSSEVAYNSRGELVYIGEGAEYKEALNGSKIYTELVNELFVTMEEGVEIKVLEPIYRPDEVKAVVDEKSGVVHYFYIGEGAPFIVVNGEEVYCGRVDEADIKKYSPEEVSFDPEKEAWYYTGDLKEGDDYTEQKPVQMELIDFEGKLKSHPRRIH